jgi:enamine deaminase RidA (YjgF/YER057c/UK114 family)
VTVERTTYEQLPQPSGAYSHVAAVGELLFTAGVGPADRAGDVPDGIAAQTRAALTNLEAVLRAAGSSFDDVVKVTVHLADVERDFDGFDSVYRSMLHAPYPVRTTVGSVLGGILIEVDVVAARQR